MKPIPELPIQFLLLHSYATLCELRYKVMLGHNNKPIFEQAELEGFAIKQPDLVSINSEQTNNWVRNEKYRRKYIVY